jgi:hypothetical protein
MFRYNNESQDIDPNNHSLKLVYSYPDLFVARSRTGRLGEVVNGRCFII